MRPSQMATPWAKSGGPFFNFNIQEDCGMVCIQAFTGEFSLQALQSSPGTSKESTRRAF